MENEKFQVQGFHSEFNELEEGCWPARLSYASPRSGPWGSARLEVARD